jgi:predicted DNA-binding transcriptional regulator AlpA
MTNGLDAALGTVREAIRTATAEELAELIGGLESASAAAWARLVAPPASPAETSDENLDAVEAARRLGMSERWLYKNAGRLPFVVRIGRRVLFSAGGLEKWNRQRQRRS